MGNRLVYSTQDDRLCARCGRSTAGCSCRKKAGGRSKHAVPAPNADGIARVSRQTKGRKGKGVTLVTGLALDAADLSSLAKQLKALCGSGGTVKDGVIEVQGEHREKLVAELTRRGLRAKLV